jgi:hypothetical protein
MLKKLKQLVMSWCAPRQTQAQKILATLQKGPASNRQLMRVAPRFGARILELRESGHDIYIHRDGRTVMYTLVGR